MIFNKPSTSLLLVYLISVITVQAKNVFPGFAVSSSVDDMEVAAAEPRPIIVESVHDAQVLPLVANKSVLDENPASASSEVVAKTLQHPFAFSFNDKDQELEATVHEIIPDQSPSAVDYYKHVKKIEDDNNDEGGAKVNGNESQENEAEEDGVANSKIKIDSEEHHGSLTSAESREDGDHESYEVHESKVHGNGGGNHGHGGGGGHGHGGGGGHGHAHEAGGGHGHGGGGEHGHGGGGGEHEHGGGHGHGHDGGHKDGGKHGSGGGHNGAGKISFKKGGGKEHYSEHMGSHGEKGDKGYKGHHNHEKGEKGHHTKEDHKKHYDEKEGDAKKHYHEDGYHAEKTHGEKGHKASKFHEEGEHSKGHSTKGEHNIRKKDEYEKKQEFYEESHEGGESEKDGSFFHEDEFHKGGHEKSGHKKGGEEEAHYGKDNHFEKGGYHKEQQGQKSADGHNKHFDHAHKYGEKKSQSGGKKWGYRDGDDGGGDGGKGSHGHKASHNHGSGSHGHAKSGHIHEAAGQDHAKYETSQIESKQGLGGNIQEHGEAGHTEESKGDGADHEHYENENQQESSEVKQEGNHLEEEEVNKDNGDDKTIQTVGDDSNGDHNAYYVGEDSNEKPTGKINNSAGKAEGEEETNEELVNEETDDGEGEESIRQQLVLAQRLSHPIPYKLLRGIRRVNLEKRQPKPFYPSPLDMSFGNVRHTVHDNIAVMGVDGSNLVPVKREMNIAYPISEAEPQTEASNVVELVSQTNDQPSTNIETVSVPPDLSAEGSFIGTVNLDFGTIDVASSSEANLNSGIVVTELETDAAL